MLDGYKYYYGVYNIGETSLIRGMNNIYELSFHPFEDDSEKVQNILIEKEYPYIYIIFEQGGYYKGKITYYTIINNVIKIEFKCYQSAKMISDYAQNLKMVFSHEIL